MAKLHQWHVAIRCYDSRLQRSVWEVITSKPRSKPDAEIFMADCQRANPLSKYRVQIAEVARPC